MPSKENRSNYTKQNDLVLRSVLTLSQFSYRGSSVDLKLLVQFMITPTTPLALRRRLY